MEQGVPRRRRARPVGDAPVDELLARVEPLTKGWLVALLERMPLEAASEILLADVVRDGPRVCDAVIRALASDTDLRRLEPGGALEPLVARTGDLAGVVGPAAASAAIDALHGVVWSALHHELYDPEPEQVSELAQRLALVIEAVRGAALRRLGGAAAERRALSSVPERASRSAEPATPPGPGGTPEPEPLASEPGPPPGPAGEPQIVAVPEPAPPVPRREDEALWIGALEEEIRRSERSGASLSLLLVELEDGHRVVDIEPPAVAGATLGRFAQAVRDAVRRPDIIASESDTRAWVIARETGRSAAHALATRLGQAVREAEPWRGAPLNVSIGVGVLGEDGRDVDSLLEAAEESRFAAEASGVDVLPGDNGGEPPAENESG